MAPVRGSTLPYLRLSHYLTLGNRCACGTPWPCLVAVTLDQAQVVEDRASAYEAALWAIVLGVRPPDIYDDPACEWCGGYWTRASSYPGAADHHATCPWQLAWNSLVAAGDEDELTVALEAQWEMQEMQHHG